LLYPFHPPTRIALHVLKFDREFRTVIPHHLQTPLQLLFREQGDELQPERLNRFEIHVAGQADAVVGHA
jgi:hypothetical protein